MAFDAATGQLVLFAGLSPHALSTFRDDTSVWVAGSDNQPPLATITLTGPNGGTPVGANGWIVQKECGYEYCLPTPVTGTITADDTTSGNSVISVTLTGPGTSTTVAASATCASDGKHLLFQCCIQPATGLVTGSPGNAITAYEDVGGGPVPVPGTGNPETIFFSK